MVKKAKKVCISALSVFMACTAVMQNPFTTVKAASEGEEISAVQKDNKVSIGNEYITREFSTSKNELKTTNIINKRTQGDTAFTPKDGSEEFIFKTTKSDSKNELPALNRDGWTATASSHQNDSGPSDGPASNLLDGDVNSIWHTNYNKPENTNGSKTYPYNVIIQLNGEKKFQSFSYTPRKEGEQVNGNIKGYELYAATSSTALAANASEWKLVAKGNFNYNGANPIYVNTDKEVTATQVKFVATSANNGLEFAGGAEFKLHAEKAVIPVNDGLSFKASDLELKEDGVEITDTSATINKVEKTGKKVTFTFEPYTFKDVTYSIKENIVMYEGDHFMRKYLEIDVPEDQKDIAT
ncbi:MAG: discoidin domain-containing protein, partial [Longicatena sp.]